TPRLPGPATLRRLAMDEDGAAYTLSYVMVIPVYALLICLIIESVLMLTAKLGTEYSAFAAARTASVWSSATTWEQTMEMAKAAATKSMTPFASGTHGGLIKAASVDALAYVAAYHVFAKKTISDKYVLSQFGYAKSHVKVEIKGPPEHWDSEITAKVTYEFPFNIPGIGRILGKRGIDGIYYYPISSEATLQNEGPQDDRKTIGIGYGTLK
ncbi:MAG TPA: hypothetical protein VFW73_11360, partial [Lacipirellulaceae bacterium]|nr:hypothetical protein [Lacipirellulaceae bacterium]